MEPVARSLAEAYAWGEIAWPRLIYDGDELVGFLMGFFRIQWRLDDPTDLRSGLWRLNIAADRQGRGYGRFAVAEVCAEARRRGETRIYTTPPDGARPPYRRRLPSRVAVATSSRWARRYRTGLADENICRVADRLADAVRAFRMAQAAAVASAQRAAEDREKVTEAREQLAAAIVEAAREGMRQVDIVRVTGYTRERVRQILRAHGVAPD